jgi:hypothetical protein
MRCDQWDEPTQPAAILLAKPGSAKSHFHRPDRMFALDGEIKKRRDIPPKTLKRIRGYRDRVLRREASARKGRKS